SSYAVTITLSFTKAGGRSTALPNTPSSSDRTAPHSTTDRPDRTYLPKNGLSGRLHPALSQSREVDVDPPQQGEAHHRGSDLLEDGHFCHQPHQKEGQSSFARPQHRARLARPGRGGDRGEHGVGHHSH